MRKNLMGLGILLMVFGAVSAILTTLDYDLRILMWINNWGESTAWIIRGGMFALGLVLAITFWTGKAKPVEAQSSQMSSGE
jgi:hypothetical protein